MYIAIDIGGTNTRVGGSKDGRNFFAIEKFKTPSKFEDGIRVIVSAVNTLVNMRPGLRRTGGRASPYRNNITVAVPSSVKPARKKLGRLPNLPGWSNQPLGKILARALHAKVRLINDADAAGIGEARRGAGRGYRRILYFTISTGIGGARIINGRIDPQALHFEPGHYTLMPRGRKCGCGRRGCFEAYASGTGFYKTYGMRTEDCKDQKIWNEYAETLGRGILNAIKDAPPDIIILGGGVSHAGVLLFKPLRAYLKNNLRLSKPLPIVPAKLGDLAGLYGGLTIL